MNTKFQTDDSRDAAGTATNGVKTIPRVSGAAPYDQAAVGFGNIQVLRNNSHYQNTGESLYAPNIYSNPKTKEAIAGDSDAVGVRS